MPVIKVLDFDRVSSKTWSLNCGLYFKELYFLSSCHSTFSKHELMNFCNYG